MPDSAIYIPQSRRRDYHISQTVWVRLSAAQGLTIRAMATHNGILVDEQARLLVVAGLDAFSLESG